MKGYAPGWRVHCTKCGRTRDAAGVGTTKTSASARKCYTLGWCSNCSWLRFAATEKNRSGRSPSRSHSTPVQ